MKRQNSAQKGEKPVRKWRRAQLVSSTEYSESESCFPQNGYIRHDMRILICDSVVNAIGETAINPYPAVILNKCTMHNIPLLKWHPLFQTGCQIRRRKILSVPEVYGGFRVR